MAWLFVRLKLSLLAGSMRGDDRRRTGFVVSTIGATLFAVTGCLGLSLLRGQGQAATDTGIVVFTSLGLSWTLLPLMSFGTDETLDPSRLTLFPLTRGQLFRGLLAAAVTGPWPLASLIVFCGGAAGLSGGAGSVAVAVVAAPLTLLMCVAASRACATGMSTLLRSRRGRDIGMAVGLLILLSMQGLTALVSSGATASADAVTTAAAVLRWTPPGMAAHAIGAAREGHYDVAMGELATVTCVVAALLWAWMAALGRALVTADASTQLGGRTRLNGWSPYGRTGAVAVKELRYAWRDPRRRMMWLSAAGMTVIVSLSSATNVVFFPVFMTAMVIGISGANAFGTDGPALWMNAVVTGHRRDLRADLAGKNIATALLGTTIVVTVSLVSAVRHGQLPGVPRTVLAGWGVLGVAIGVATLVSVLFPYALPERRGNMLSHPGAGKGGVAFAAAISSTMMTGLLALPIVIPLAIGGTLGWAAAVAAPVYGMGLAWGARALAARIGVNRLPEILAAVSRAE